MLMGNVMLTECKRWNLLLWKCNTQTVDGAHITKKNEIAECSIKPAASVLTASMWKHGCSCFQLEDHRASDIKFFTRLGKSEANYKLYCNSDRQGLVSVFSGALLHTACISTRAKSVC